MIVLAVELQKRRLKVIADAREDIAQRVKVRLRENVAAILCHEDQVYMEREDAVPASSEVACVCHRPNVIMGR